MEIGDLMIIYGTTNLTFPSQTSKFSWTCGTDKEFIVVSFFGMINFFSGSSGVT
jgi:hypothetical protein